MKRYALFVVLPVTVLFADTPPETMPATMPATAATVPAATVPAATAPAATAPAMTVPAATVPAATASRPATSTGPKTQAAKSAPVPDYKEASRVAWIVGLHETTAKGPAFMKEEIGRAVDRMRLGASVAVFTVGAEITPLSGKDYLRTFSADKKQLLDALEAAKAAGDPTKVGDYAGAIEKALAFEYPPEVLHLVVDSAFDADLGEKIKKLNKKSKTKILVYAYMLPAGMDVQVLKDIAAENGGKFKAITKEEVEGP